MVIKVASINVINFFNFILKLAHRHWLASGSKQSLEASRESYQIIARFDKLW